jgi:hypothetical protein
VIRGRKKITQRPGGRGGTQRKREKQVPRGTCKRRQAVDDKLVVEGEVEIPSKLRASLRRAKDALLRMTSARCGGKGAGIKASATGKKEERQGA